MARWAANTPSEANSEMPDFQKCKAWDFRCVSRILEPEMKFEPQHLQQLAILGFSSLVRRRRTCLTAAAAIGTGSA
jgi:hypothetical protein